MEQKKTNCWEFMKCGREPGGGKSFELGICTASTEVLTDYLNNGLNGGRVCWALTATLCAGEIQGNFAEKMSQCMECEFYKKVQEEEGKDWKGSKQIFEFLSGIK